MGIPDHESTFGEHPVQYHWMEYVYDNHTEAIPHDTPEPKGKMLCTSIYKDATLMHNLIMWRSASGFSFSQSDTN